MPKVILLQKVFMIVQQTQQHILLRTMWINIQMLVVALNKLHLRNVENATTDKTAYKMEVTLGNDAYSEEIIVDYGNKKHNRLFQVQTISIMKIYHEI